MKPLVCEKEKKKKKTKANQKPEVLGWIITHLFNLKGHLKNCES